MVDLSNHTQFMLELFFALVYVCQPFHCYCPLVFQDPLVHKTRCAPPNLTLELPSCSLQLLVSISPEVVGYHLIANLSWPYSC
uniref:Uncharacterized protein n=1 Tax=Triticum urartu TaxID=4572 RepID=A0A8R7V6F9_TRIUA